MTTVQNIQELPQGRFISCNANFPLTAANMVAVKEFQFDNFDTDNVTAKRYLGEFYPFVALSFFATSRDYQYNLTLDTGMQIFLPPGAIVNLPEQAGAINGFTMRVTRQDGKAFGDNEKAGFQISAIGVYGYRGL